MNSKTDFQVNSAFHSSGVRKSSTDLPGWGKGGARQLYWV